MSNNFDDTKDQLFSIEEKITKNPAYKKMLNNLLGIGNRDEAVFMSSQATNHDLSKILSKSDYTKILNLGDFQRLEIVDLGDDSLFARLDETSSISDFIDLVEENGIYLSMTERVNLENDFEGYKSICINKIIQKKNKKISKWKQFRDKYLEKQVENNSWPLYICHLFIKVTVQKTTLYAPLLLKRANIEITPTNKVYIKCSDDSVETNDKLLFLLQNAFQFSLPALKEDQSYSLAEVSQKYLECLSHVIVMPDQVQLEGSFEFFHKTAIKNENIECAKGSTLSIISPSGGKLRDKLIELISQDVIETCLDIDPLRNIKKEVETKIENSTPLFRITPTDVSQEKAIFGSLLDSSIIWGPPGTGKSQTIANILANLLFEDKNVFVTSEKKAALDVIQTRMGTLSKYILFGLTDKNVDKDAFYLPFKKLMEKITNVDPSIEEGKTETSKKPLISNEEKAFFEIAKKLENEDLKVLISLNKRLEKHPTVNSETLKKISGIVSRNLKVIQDTKKIGHLIAALEANGIVKKGFLFKKYTSEISALINFLEEIKNEIDFLDDLSKVKDLQNFESLSSFLETETLYAKYHHKFTNDEQLLDNYLAYVFRQRIVTLRKSDPILSRKIASFIKGCNSGFRLPHKFTETHKEVISLIFKVFVSTPQTLSNLIDMNKTYDYAIFDEASQLHVEKAIPFLAIAEKSIIAGDNQQMQPTSYFAKRDDTTVLEDVEENTASLLDYAYRKGLKSTREYMLTKNYRSVSSELMLFSSKEFYDNNLDVIDSMYAINNECIEVYHIKDGQWVSQANEQEAIAMLNKVLETAPLFKSIIILTFNASQKSFVETLIYNEEKYNPIIEWIMEEKIKLRNLENVQGDEADLVIASVAYDKNTSFGATYVAKPAGRNALNVAISRAKVKMIVFKSIVSDDVTGGSTNPSILTFKRWLLYLEMSKKERQQIAKVNRDNQNTLLPDGQASLEHFDSDFERDVFDYLKRNLWTSGRQVYLKTQYSVGTYLIDLVVIDKNSGRFILGLEIDGYKYHSGYSKMVEDIERQRYIEAKGYPIYRITEIQWRINKENTVDEIARLINRFH